jgi:hypothetical protein
MANYIDGFFSRITILSIFVSWVFLLFEYFAASLSKEELQGFGGDSRLRVGSKQVREELLGLRPE